MYQKYLKTHTFNTKKERASIYIYLICSNILKRYSKIHQLANY